MEYIFEGMWFDRSKDDEACIGEQHVLAKIFTTYEEAKKAEKQFQESFSRPGFFWETTIVTLPRKFTLNQEEINLLLSLTTCIRPDDYTVDDFKMIQSIRKRMKNFDSEKESDVSPFENDPDELPF